jgi:hypothetical protein
VRVGLTRLILLVFANAFPFASLLSGIGSTSQSVSLVVSAVGIVLFDVLIRSLGWIVYIAIAVANAAITADAAAVLAPDAVTGVTVAAGQAPLPATQV